MRTLPPLPPTIRLLNDWELNRLRRQSGYQFSSVRKCITCGGAGQFWALDENNEPADFECPCADQWKLYHFFLNRNLYVLLQRMQWRDATNVPDKARAAIETYLADPDIHLRTGRGMILTSKDRGIGKTLLATLLLKKLLALGVDGFFILYTDLRDHMLSEWRKDEEEKEWFTRRIKHAGVLVIDDVGKDLQREGVKEWSDERFDLILKTRMYSQLPTIVTSNLSLEELEQGYGGRTMAALTTMCDVHALGGFDYRPTYKIKVEDLKKKHLIRPLVIE